MKKPPAFTLEKDLCAAFLTEASRDKRWTFYPETAGWDILAVCDDGRQVGIQAKLRLNVEVVVQALPYWRSQVEQGPHYRAVLVPEGVTQGGIRAICHALAITVVTLRRTNEEWDRRPFRINPELPVGPFRDIEEWPEWCPTQPCHLPEYVPDCRAGSSAPLQLTHWKIKAIRLAILLDERPVTRADFKALGLDPRRWTDHWLRATPDGYVRTESCPNFAAQHPANYAEIKADRAKWDRVTK